MPHSSGGATPAGVVLTAAPTTSIQAAVVGVFNMPIVADTQFAQQSLDHDQLRSGPQICDFHDGLTATAKEEGESVASSSGGEVSLHPTRGQFRSLGRTGHWRRRSRDDITDVQLVLRRSLQVALNPWQT